jgi:hypothetical protein
VKKLPAILLGTVLFSCNPYEPYFFTHYHIQAELDPGSGRISANVQMVFVARNEYSDSICFRLNPGLNLQTLAAQDLEHYIYRQSDSGWLVIFLEDPIGPNDQLHISLSYSGQLSESTLKVREEDPRDFIQMDSNLLWYPASEDTRPFTYQVKFDLPGSWQMLQPNAEEVHRGKWLIRSGEPQKSMNFLFARRQ